MRAAAVLVSALLMGPAASQPEGWRVGMSCEGVLPEIVVIEASGPGTLALIYADLLAACLEAMPLSKRWRGGS